MEKQSSKKKKALLGQVLLGFGFGILGAICGAMIVTLMESEMMADATALERLLTFFALFLGLYVILYLHIVLHEAGHLLFGRITGYRFGSFRIGSLMWIREGDRLRFRRMSIAGTGGQCLMCPPEMRDGKFPVVLYNLGGVLVNLFVGALSLLGYFGFDKGIVSSLCLISAMTGLVYALINGLPLPMTLISNDGSNALALCKNAATRRAFGIQLRVNEQIARGCRLRDMPAEWFAVPADEDMKDPLTAALGVFACNRLMDEQRFDEADALMIRLLDADIAMVGVHRNLMICDRIFCELIAEKREEVIDDLLTAEQKKFMKSMKKFPTVLRTEYVLARLFYWDVERAEKIGAQFEKVTRTYPYPNDIESERELMQIADRIADASPDA